MKQCEYIVKCSDDDTYQAAMKIALEHTDLYRTIEETSVCYPGGVRQEKAESFCVGDYFHWINIEIAQEDYKFKVIFEIDYEHGTGRNYYKDIMVRLMGALEAIGVKVEVL
jgi:hypothetical protein